MMLSSVLSSNPNTWTRSLSLELRGHNQPNHPHHPQQQHTSHLGQQQHGVHQVKSSLKQVEYIVQNPINRGPTEPNLEKRQGLASNSIPRPVRAPINHQNQVQHQVHVPDLQVPSASEVREIRLKWSDKIESNTDDHEMYDSPNKMMKKDKMMEDKMADKREKRFLDPDDVSAGGVVDLDDIQNVTKSKEEDEPDLSVRFGSYNKNATQDDDPHQEGEQFCVDISEYLDLKWVLKDAEECHVSFNR